MLILRIIAAPVWLALELLAAFVGFLACVAAGICCVISILLVLLAIVLFITGQFVGGIVLIVLAFLASPFGVPAIAGHLAGAVYDAKDALGRFISG